jgi:anti-sigma regulatory factor (Ser/Thr protein kinase)
MTPAAGHAAPTLVVFSQPAHSQLASDRLDPRARPGSYACADLAPDPAAAAQARRLTRETLARWDMRHLTDDAVAVASELAANAINSAIPARGTLPAIIFAVHRRPVELRIIVWDNGRGHPHHSAPDPDAETGRGLAIIDSLSARKWGWWPTPHSGGKVVWAALPASAPDAAAPQPTAS